MNRAISITALPKTISLSALSRAWAERRRTRLELRQLDDHMLRDIGITRVDADVEAHKPFWQV